MAAQAGDPKALEALLCRHLRELRTFVRSRCTALVLAHESVSDVVQWICLEAVRRVDGFDHRGPSSFRNWLFAIARNVIGNRIHYWRRDKRDARREVDVATLEHLVADPGASRDPMEWRERLARIEAALDRLPDVYAEVVVKARLLGMSHSKIAVEIDRTPAAARAILCRAMRQLRCIVRQPHENGPLRIPAHFG